MEDNDIDEQPEILKDTTVPLPFPVFTVRKIAKQVLLYHKVGKQAYQRGISQKAGVVLSIATGIFLRNLARCALNSSTELYIKRKLVVSVLLKNPSYRFSMVRMKPVELFDVFIEKNEISQKIASKHIEQKIKFPIELVAPNPPDKHVYNEAKANQRETENLEYIIKSLIVGNHAYHQTIPSFLFRQNDD